MAEVDRQADLDRVAREEQAVKDAAERKRVADLEEQLRQARARMILDQKRGD